MIKPGDRVRANRYPVRALDGTVKSTLSHPEDEYTIVIVQHDGASETIPYRHDELTVIDDRPNGGDHAR